MVERKRLKFLVNQQFERGPVVALLGPRQSGKTTIAKEFGVAHFFDLENPTGYNSK